MSTTKKVVKKSPVAEPVKKAAKKKVVKKAAKKKVVKGKKETVRVRALRALLERNMTASEVKDVIELSHGLKPTLDQEVELGHLKEAPYETEGAHTTYQITADGKKFLAE